MGSSLHLVLLGSGKTGSLVAEVAHERGHKTTVLTDVENPDGVWLTAENLRDADAVVDFTAPEAVLTNIAKCIAAGKPLGVGTTGWGGGEAEGGRDDRLVRRDEARAAGSGARRHGICVWRKLFLRDKPILPDCPRRRSGPAARIQRTHHGAPSHPQERRSVGHGGGAATGGGASVRNAGGNHVGARGRRDGRPHP